MTNFGPLVAEICWRVWGTPANFNGFRVLASLLQQRRSPEANHTCTMFGRLLAGMPYMGGSCSLTEFRHVQNSLCVQRSKSCVLLGSVTARHASSGISQTLQHGTRNGITELSQRAPPIFGSAAITLGIGPHSTVRSKARLQQSCCLSVTLTLSKLTNGTCRGRSRELSNCDNLDPELITIHYSQLV